MSEFTNIAEDLNAYGNEKKKAEFLKKLQPIMNMFREEHNSKLAVKAKVITPEAQVFPFSDYCNGLSDNARKELSVDFAVYKELQALRDKEISTIIASAVNKIDEASYLQPLDTPFYTVSFNITEEQSIDVKAKNMTAGYSKDSTGVVRCYKLPDDCFKTSIQKGAVLKAREKGDPGVLDAFAAGVFVDTVERKKVATVTTIKEVNIINDEEAI